MKRNRVSVGDWACSAPDREVDSHGCQILLSEIKGWFDGPGVRANPLERPAADGDYDGNPTQDSRVVTITGTITAPTDVALQESMDDLDALLTGTTRYDTLTVDEVSRDMSRRATVRLADGTLIQRDSDTHATFSLALFAPDPRRYSSELHAVTVGRYMPGGGFSFPASFPISFGSNGSSGVASVSNAGSTSTWPVLRFSGPLTNPSARLVGDGAVTAGLTLVSGQELVVDCGLRSVLLGQASRRQFLTADSFFAVPPGQSQIYFSADDGDGTLTVEWRDAW